MPIGSPPLRTAGLVAVAALAGLVSLLAVRDRWNDAPNPSRSGNIQIVGRALPAPVTSPAMARSLPPATIGRAPSAQAVTTALLERFPAIREARIICEGDCKLVAALGDQSLGQTPFGGNLERYLAERGYEPIGGVTVDQPGDNDTLLTVTLRRPTQVH